MRVLEAGPPNPVPVRVCLPAATVARDVVEMALVELEAVATVAAWNLPKNCTASSGRGGEACLVPLVQASALLPGAG